MLCLSVFKEADVFKDFLGYYIMKDQYIIKLLKDEGALVSDRSNV